MEVLDGINVSGIHIETRVDYITREFLDELKAQRVKSLFLGVESGSDRLLQLLNKGFDRARIDKTLGLLGDYPFQLKLSFILGAPTETLDEYRQTLMLVLWCIEHFHDVGFTLGFYLPFPGTPLFDLCVERGFEPPDDFVGWEVLDRWGNQNMTIPWIEGNYLCPEEVHRLRTMVNYMCRLGPNRSWAQALWFKYYRYRIMYSGTMIVRMGSWCSNLMDRVTRALHQLIAPLIPRNVKIFMRKLVGAPVPVVSAEDGEHV